MPPIRGGHLGTKSDSSSTTTEALGIFLRWLSVAQNGSMCLLYLVLKSLSRSNLMKFNEKLQAFFSMVNSMNFSSQLVWVSRQKRSWARQGIWIEGEGISELFDLS